MVVLALVKMAEWKLRHGPKDVIEIDDEDEMTEAKLYGRIHSQLEFCREVFGHLASNYRKLVRLKQKRREARAREWKERWKEKKRLQEEEQKLKKRLQEEEQKEVASRMCFVCRQKFEKVNKVEEKREISRSRSRSRRVSMSAASR